ncbi:MAG TPA: T9SS type A sorting domain-containing protein [Cyclobacteriaceae bacterium]|nr:T9SS type A sorting domain-containing protein [Cyclobacteriaceae bacterium]
MIMLRTPRALIFLSFLFLSITSFAQSTSWVGSTSNNWKVASNWTNGVPDATKDAFLGDNSFTGANQPTLPSGTGSGTCKSLTVGGFRATTLVVNDDLTVSGAVLFNSNATISHTAGNFIVRGNWTNNGSYTGSAATIRVYMQGTGGVVQQIGGTTITTFRRLYVSTGASVQLTNSINVATFLNLAGIFEPSTFQVQGAGSIDLGSNALLKVNTGLFTGNYNHSGGTNCNSNSSVVEYTSTTLAQTVSSAFNYRDIRIAGTTTKTLAANITILSDMFITGGTFDLQGFTANRSTSGGSLTMAAGTTMRIGGTGTFPANFTTRSLAVTSTVDYYGGNQVVTPLSYGNLTMNCSSSGITKSSAATAFTVAGNLLLNCASPNTMIFNAAQNVTVNLNTTIQNGSTFNGNNFNVAVKGNWTNAGVFNAGAACTATFTSSGANAIWSGTGTHTFSNVTITGNGTTIDAATLINVCGNLATSGGGTLTHTTGGAGFCIMSGTTKTISGANIIFDDLSVTGSITTSATYSVGGAFAVSGSFTASSGTISMIGSNKVIGGNGAMTVSSLNIPGIVTTSRDFTVTGNLSVAGSLTASAGVVTFNGTSSTFSGTANLFNIAISPSRTLIMGANANLGIAGTETLGAGFVFNVTTNTPNTVTYNSTAANQTVSLVTFNNLVLTNGNTKTASGAKTVNGNLTIGTSTTFAAGTFTHTVLRNWTNNGTFTPGTSTVQFTGTFDATITGATTFNTFTVNKGLSNVVTVLNNIITTNAIITQGTVSTGPNSITITSTRTGNGFILGTITRTHAFVAGTNYTFEGPNNFINFAPVGTVTSVTVTVTIGLITSFPNGAAINRNYNVNVTGTGYTATMRLHYQQAEVNGNAEAAMNLWYKPAAVWSNMARLNLDATANWVELNNISALVGDWTCSDGGTAFNWLGGTSSSWFTASNWSSNTVPSVSDIVRIGHVAFTNQPTISGSASAKGLNFGSAQPVTLTVTTGSTLDVQGNIDGTYLANASHNIILQDGTVLLSDTDVVLSDGTPNHNINLSIGASIVSIVGSLTQSGGASITFTGAGNLSIGDSFIYSSGTFTGGTGTVTYNGPNDQFVAPVPYNNLTVNKSSGVAVVNTPVTVGGNVLLLTAGGQLEVDDVFTVGGNITINSGAILTDISSTINIGGNWVTTGTFNPGDGTVSFNGTGAQSVNATTFNNVTVNKASGTLTVTGNLGINGNINIQNGTVDVQTFDVTRTTTGGTAALGAGAFVRFSGTTLQIQNFAALTTDPASTVEYNGTTARNIPPITFGNLIISNGGANAKTMIGPTVVQSNLTVNSNSTLVAPSTTLQVGGNIVIGGTFNTGTSTLVLTGTAKTISESGLITYNNMVVNGSYTVTSGDVTFNGDLTVNSSASIDFGTAIVTSHGDFTNAGVTSSAGVVTFTGLQVQTLQLTGTLSASTGIVNFNGNVSPVLNSSTSPAFATVNINNSAPIQASQGWIVTTAFNIASGATWDGGALNHTILGSFANSGTVTSSGTITFSPTTNVNINLGTNFSSTGKVVFAGTGLITLAGAAATFDAIDVTNSNAAGITTPTGWSLAGDIFVSAAATLHASSFTHTIAGGWNNNGTFDGGTSTVVFTSNTTTDEIIGGGTTNFNNITFASGSSLTVVAPINIMGNLTNNSTSLLFEFGKATFIGTGLSIIGGTTATAFDDMELNKTGSGSVRLDLNTTINDTFILTAGVLDLNARTLSLLNTLGTAIQRTGGYVLSENTSMLSRIAWTVGVDVSLHEFPFGTSAGVYIPFRFTKTNATDADIVTLATYGTGGNNLPYPPTVTHVGSTTGTNNSANTVDRFWSISVSGTATATITFTVSPAEASGITNLQAQRWNGTTAWVAPTGGQSNTATSATAPGIAAFSMWTLSGNSSALPIELSSFSGRQEGNHVGLQWTTNSERNNDYFDIEKSSDGEKFVSIGKVKGAGTSTERRTYSFNDNEIAKGRIFYRLNQVDVDKVMSYSKVIAINVENTDPVEFSFYPNPVVDQKLNISSTSPYRDVLSISIIDQTGRTVLKAEAANFGQEAVEIGTGELPPGTYIVRLQFSNYTKSQRIVVDR